MRVCPNCGFIEAQYWRNDRYKRDVQICHISDLEFDNLELASKIKEGEERKFAGYVVRRANIDGKAWNTWNATFEARHRISLKSKGQAKLMKKQTKLKVA